MALLLVGLVAATPHSASAAPAKTPGKTTTKRTVGNPWPLKVVGKATVTSIVTTVTVKGKTKLPRTPKSRLQYRAGSKWVTATQRSVKNRSVTLTWVKALPGTRYRLRVQLMQRRKVVATSKSFLLLRPRPRPVAVPAPTTPKATPTPVATPPAATPAPAPTPTPTTPGTDPDVPPTTDPDVRPLALQLDSAIAVGDDHSCTITQGQLVRCWGDNTYGQLGMGDRVARAKATLVPGLSGVVALAAGQRGTCALEVDRETFCWGELDPSLPNRLVPFNATSRIGQASRIAAAGYTICALIPTGASCLETSSGTVKSVPLMGGETASDIAVTVDWTCARLDDAAYRCWGRGANVNADLAEKAPHATSAIDAGSFVNTLDPPCAPPTSGPHYRCGTGPIAAIDDWNDAFASADVITGVGGSRRCAIAPDGGVWCLEDPTARQAGAGEAYRPDGPSPLPNLTLAASLAVGLNHSCALRTDFSVKCWGSNAGNQLGTGTLGSPSNDMPSTVVLAS